MFVFKLSVSQTDSQSRKSSPALALCFTSSSVVIPTLNERPTESARFLSQCSTSFDWMADQRRSRWSGIKSSLAQCQVFFRPHAVILLPWPTRVGASADLIRRNNCFCLKGQAIPGSVRYPRTGTDPWGPRWSSYSWCMIGLPRPRTTLAARPPTGPGLTLFIIIRVAQTKTVIPC